MKRLMAAALALSLLDGAAALAQEDHHAPPPRAAAPAPHGHAGGGAPAPDRGFSPPPPRPSQPGPYAYVPQGHGDRPHVDGAPAAPAAGGGWHGARPSFGAPGFQPGGGDRPRYDARFFPHAARPAGHFQWRGDREWAPQPGYYAHHWRYGDYLPEGWFAASFWIYDYDDYSLPVPPYGYEWVRYGPDALLVDTYSGEVVETVYGLFY
jgi:Ni/Co efflux regulator RcnB